MSSAPPRSATLDLTIGVIGLWLASGFLLDSWAHLHVPVETFFTPYHGVFYAAMATGAVVLIVTALRNRSKGYTGWNVLPAPYQQAMIGVPIFFLGGVGDLIWHTIFGIEDRVEAVTSPTHLIIGLGVLIVTSAPIRSALESRDELKTLFSQLPLLFSIATWLEFIHLGTAYVFEPAAARIYTPPNGILYSPDYFTNSTLLLYKVGAGVAIVLLQTLILMLFVVWVASRFKLRPGAMVVLFLTANCIIAAALTNDTLLFVTYVIMSVVAGIVADILIAGADGPLQPPALRVFGFVVPVVYYGTYFAVTALSGGVWMNPSLVGGALVWAGVAGVGLTLLVPETARSG
ncbi:MAG: hypothetical protein JO349_04255 [Candidatus Eremiobacteraeota bacterium]|nr:hypothetical protein [Candidatus Eremiobacteraeota bacterium]